MEELELSQAFLITEEDVRGIAKDSCLAIGEVLLAKRLRNRGWLPKTEWGASGNPRSMLEQARSSILECLGGKLAGTES